MFDAPMPVQVFYLIVLIIRELWPLWILLSALIFYATVKRLKD